ncbi:MAG TPA: SRPBCC family protein [Phycisphaerales bacterium]|nr:SRPBCC family protein [Phycisphaerales bacterium]
MLATTANASLAHGHDRPAVLGAKRRSDQHALHTLRTETLSPLPIERVFAFFADPFNLESLTPPWLRFRVLTPPPIAMREGLALDYRLRVRGLAMRWRSVILAWEPPDRFVDAQSVGPYAWWWHEHRFEQLPGGGTRITDTVEYAAPGGRLLHDVLVRPDLERIFAYRSVRMRELLGG